MTTTTTTTWSLTGSQPASSLSQALSSSNNFVQGPAALNLYLCVAGSSGICSVVSMPGNEPQSVESEGVVAVVPLTAAPGGVCTKHVTRKHALFSGFKRSVSVSIRTPDGMPVDFYSRPYSYILEVTPLVEERKHPPAIAS